MFPDFFVSKTGEHEDARREINDLAREQMQSWRDVQQKTGEHDEKFGEHVARIDFEQRRTARAKEKVSDEFCSQAGAAPLSAGADLDSGTNFGRPY